MTDIGAVPAPAASAGRPRAVLFDWDNTLVDSWPTIHDALNATLAAMGRPPWSIAETRERVRLSLRDSFPRLFGARWEEARQIYLDRFRAIHLDRLTALPGSEELLAALAASEFYLAVVSNKTGPILRREAEQLGWTRYFACLVGANDAAADKPDAAPIHMALAGSGIAAGPHVWYVGDTAIDIECAGNAGCVGVLLGSAESDDPGFARFAPQLAFRDGSELFRHLRTL